jgi:hypothetical protein
MNDQNINEIEQAVQLQEKIFTLFKGTEAENVFEILERKSLSLTGEQIKILLYLLSFKDDEINNFVNKYLEFKAYNRVYKVLLEALRYYSLIDLIRSKVRANINIAQK